MRKLLMRIIVIFTFLISVSIKATGEENHLAELYFTNITHVSSDLFDDLSDLPYEVPSIISNEESTVLGAELTQDLCILGIGEKPIKLILHMYTVADPMAMFSEENILAKIKINGVTHFTITGNREIVDRSLQPRRLSDTEFAYLSGYLRALVDTSSCY